MFHNNKQGGGSRGGIFVQKAGLNIIELLGACLHAKYLTYVLGALHSFIGLISEGSVENRYYIKRNTNTVKSAYCDHLGPDQK
jgi:hypothetical protein